MAFELALDELRARFGLSGDAMKSLETYAGMLVDDELAPTTVREPHAVRDDHLADALVALDLPQIREAGEIADLGAGAGVPGLPLAAALPDTSFSLLDGSSRKCEFMRRAVEAMGLDNVTVLHERAETWRSGVGRCDVVTARALAPLDIVEEYAAPLLVLGGSLVVWRGKPEPDAEAAGRRAAEILGLSENAPAKVSPYAGAANRYLHVYTKTSQTPSRFPRRDGVARKRPLGKR